jgi:N-methylhydantoinase B
MFHPSPPSPCFLYGWPAMQAMEAVYHAVAEAVPEAVPACSGGDIAALVWWGVREKTGEPWADGFPTPIGQGGSVHGDGASSLIHHAEAATRFSPTEVWESKNPWVVEKVELAPDSCGPGQHRGGLGVDFFFHMLEDCYVTSAVERTKTRPWGLQGGGEARPNGAVLQRPDGSRMEFGKATRLLVAKGATLELHTGGGGGYGPPADRDREAVEADLREGYITAEHARRHYPHAV